MRTLKRILPLIIILSLCLAGCTSSGGGGSSSESGYTQISQDEAKKMIEKDDGHIIVTDEPEAASTGSSAEEVRQDSAVLTFDSFDGGGYEYAVEIEDPDILSYSQVRDYGDSRDELATGSPYTMSYTFTGMRPGTTTVIVRTRSPIIENADWFYEVVVGDDLKVTLAPIKKISTLDLYRSADMYYPSYKVWMETDGYRMSLDEEEEFPISSESVDSIIEVAEAYGLEGWDGFDESREGVLDGEAFWMEIRFTDGTSITAHGDNAFPDHYFDAISQIQEILDQAASGASEEGGTFSLGYNGSGEEYSWTVPVYQNEKSMKASLLRKVEEGAVNEILNEYREIAGSYRDPDQPSVDLDEKVRTGKIPPFGREYTYEDSLPHFYASESHFIEVCGDMWEDIGIARIDLNNDGTDELLIGHKASEYSTEDEPTPLFAAYDIKEGRIRTIFHGWSRSAYYLAEDGSIIHTGSNGASNYEIIKYHLAQDEVGEPLLEETEALAADGMSDPENPYTWFPEGREIQGYDDYNLPVYSFAQSEQMDEEKGSEAYSRIYEQAIYLALDEMPSE